MKKLNVGDEIKDCFMQGIGTIDNICNKGIIEAAGKDWVIIRDLEQDTPILANRNLKELTNFLNK